VDSGTASMHSFVTGFYVPFALLTPVFFLHYGRLLLNHPAIGGGGQYALYAPFALAFAGSTLLKIFAPYEYAYAYFTTYEFYVELVALVLDLSVVIWLFFALDRCATPEDISRAA